MQELLVSTTVFASFLAGVVALLAPCCVSVMLPAYFASSFRHRRHILGMTLVFAAGVGTVILPVALGASALSRLFIGQHTLVFSIGGALMVTAGFVMIAGVKLALPMPGFRAKPGGGLGATYSLGAFSGIASVCCAPVLAGVAAVSGAAASFPAALTVGIAYVFGMVAPLCLLALLWDRRDWGSTRLLTGRSVSVRLGPWRRQVPLWALISGGLMVAMGLLTIVLALYRPAMATDGWQVQVTAWLNHVVAVVVRTIAFIPGWVTAVAVLGALAALIVLARRGRTAPQTSDEQTRKAHR
ncbi:MAG: cytochrome c biogenesis CcdA family protein [Haloechinothrix sp.]